MHSKTGKLFIISAPSGAGKTTLVSAVLNKWQGGRSVERVITYTSKKPRAGEVDGRDYHFLSQGEFERRIKEGFFIEWSDAYGAYYGSPRYIFDEIKQGKSYILIIDRIGAQQIVQNYSDLVLVWIYTVSLQVLRERLIARATEGKSDLAHRLEQAGKEIELEFQQKLYDYHILNDDFNIAVDQLLSVFLTELQGNFNN